MILNFGMDSRPSFIKRFTLHIIFLLMLSSCGGGSKDAAPFLPATAPNTGGGYTFLASGGTFNNGSGTNGFAMIATIRNASGYGPVDMWTITITDPNNNGISVDYFDPSQGSYMNWEWSGWTPVAGTYHVTATNGVITLSYNFTVGSGVIARAAPNVSYVGYDLYLTWPAVTGAGSYAYEVCSPAGTCLSGLVTSPSAIVTFSPLGSGDYSIRITAYTNNLLALYGLHAASPSLVAEKVSEYIFSFPVGGNQNPGSYVLKAAGGVLDYDLHGSNNNPIYGLAIWTSIQDITNINNPAAPAGDWNILVQDPAGRTMNYIYPNGDRHYAYWYYGVEPISAGTYTITATYGSATETAAFTLDSTQPALTPLLYSQITGTLVPNQTNNSLNDISLTWHSVTGAKSYYVSLWADAWDSVAKQHEYSEVWGEWVKDSGTSFSSVRVLNGSIQYDGTPLYNIWCDVYVTAYQVDMTAAAPPDPRPARADMSENYYGYPLPFRTP